MRPDETAQRGLARSLEKLYRSKMSLDTTEGSGLDNALLL